jgi:hypothetical protein
VIHRRGEQVFALPTPLYIAQVFLHRACATLAFLEDFWKVSDEHLYRARAMFHISGSMCGRVIVVVRDTTRKAVEMDNNNNDKETFLFEFINEDFGNVDAPLMEKIDVTLEVGELGFLVKLLEEIHSAMVNAVEGIAHEDIPQEVGFKGLSLEIILRRLSSFFNENYGHVIEDIAIKDAVDEAQEFLQGF